MDLIKELRGQAVKDDDKMAKRDANVVGSSRQTTHLVMGFVGKGLCHWDNSVWDRIDAVVEGFEGRGSGACGRQ